MIDGGSPEDLSDPARLSSLQRTGLLDSPPEPYFDRITKLACRLLNSETALVSLVTHNRQFFKSSCGLSGPLAQARETPLSHSFCAYVVTSAAPFVIPDARERPDLAEHGAVRDLGVVSYLGVPLHAPDGQVIGSLCALNGTSRAWSDEDLATLRDLAQIVDDDLALRHRAKRSDQLAVENGVLAREYHHRVKNALAVSAALVKMTSRDARSIEDLVEKASQRLAALASAHDQLIQRPDSIDLRELTFRLLSPYCPENAVADVEGPDVTLRYDQITPVCFFLHELATNSAKYGAFKRDGRVSLRWTIVDGLLQLDWNENLTDAMQRSPEGFGSRLVELAARQLGGSTKTTWSEDGLSVSLDFPVSVETPSATETR